METGRIEPCSILDFVKIAMQAFHSKLDKLEIEFDLIHDHYALMRDHNIPIPDLEYASYLMMNNDFQACKEAMEIVEETKNENIKRFSSDLAVEVDKLRKDVITIRETAQNPMTLDPDADQEVVLEYMSKLNQDVTTQKIAAQRIVMYQKLFQVDESRFDDLLQAAEEVDLRYSLWQGLKELAEKSGAWIATHFESLDTQEVEEVVNRYAKLTVKLERGIVPNPVVQRLRKQVDDLRLSVPVMQNMRNKCLRDRHWKKIELEISHKIERNAQFTLGKLIEYNVMEYKAAIANISNEATQEAALEELMEGVKQKWSTIEFVVKQYKEFKDVYVLGGVDDVLSALEDSMVTMNTVTSSRYVAGIKGEVDKMEGQLKHFGKTLDQWCECQKQWMYLESIFSAPDIQRQLPNESKAFFAVDKQFKDIMKRTHDRANALQAGTSPGWLETFQKSNETLEKIQKNLEDYLETKRMAFPRFYFLSNDELLEILAQTRNVQAVQPHMSKCFDGIRSLDFGEDPKSIDIYAMISGEGERVGLGKNLKARGNVENWLTSVEQNMVSSLRRLAKAAVQDYDKRPRPQWTLLHAAQLVVMTSQIYWSKMVEDALKGGGEKSVETLLVESLNLCISQLEALSVLVRGELKSLQRKILCALITIDVHARDILDDMIREKIFKSTEFGWQMQLRYYWDDELEDSTIRQTNARFTYAYEYLGAQPRLVITPLTDRCYMTLTGALHLKLGGAPAGPAGTGKTETTKDLAKALGIQCVVFNCGDNLDFRFMGKFFAGLAQCGAWACFDEFNRIDIEVLSVVAQQLLTIQNALKARLARFNFEGREIKLLATCGVFITMNPGYAGRTELPDNLKVLFRPVSMMIPDYALVAEVMLFSEGFANAKVLSRKMVKLYKLSSEQLSQQDHYDFGMRAVKSVLVMAGALKRANPDLVEDVVLIRAFKDSNLPKFLAQDVSLFLAIITDLFPGVEIPPQDFGELKLAIEECILEGGLQIVDAFVIKVIQLFETMNVRFGVMAVGPTGGGKTTCYRLLRDAMTKLRVRGHDNPAFQKTHAYVLNPKCIKMGELYGEYNLLTNEWTDGLGSTIIRAAVADTTQDRKWIVFDGPVDAIWIENMNTVLDDNCVLCLPNGERIKLNPTTMRMLFEVQDLAVASPATVSRCGMVYVPPEELGWRPYVKSWLQRFPKEIGIVLTPQCRDYIQGLFNEWMDTGLKFLRNHLQETIPSVNINIVTTLCWYYQGLLQPSRGISLAGEFNDQITGTLSRIFAFAFVWSVGGNIRHTSIERFDKFIRKECETLAAYPGGDTVFEYFVNVKEQSLSPWEEVIPSFTYKPGVSFFSLMVPTLDTVRLGWLFELNIEIQRSVLFAGVSGAGKSAIVLDLISKLAEAKNMMAIVLNFSAQTTAIATQEAIESKLEKKGKNRFGGPFGKKIICFVDDVNMPMREKYFAQPPIELLRQFQDFRGFYDRVHLFWKDIADMTIAAACGPPGGGRNEVTPRFFRHFSMVSVQPPTEMTLRTIFGAILSGFLALFPAECKPYTKPIVDCSIEVFMRMSQELLPTPQKSHYTFNLRDVSKIFQGILMVKPVDCATKKQLRSLWIHESMRVFHDRLINAEDKLYFTTIVHELLKRSMETIETHKELFEDQIIMYGDFLRPGYSAEDRRYEQVTDFSKLPQLFKDYLEDYNMSTPKVMKLVFFKDAIAHTARLARILRQPRGNAMLVGVGGSGKQSLTRFACFLSEYTCFQIELTKGYSNFEFREDLKKIYKVAGIDGKPITFLFTDTQIVNEGFVEDINNLLNSGEVPGLFAVDEKDRLCVDIREYALTLGIPLTKDSLYNCFINRSREFIHVVLCMSPVGDPFRSRCRQFPSLINCCTIDWFDEWPEEALLTVSNHFLAAVDLGNDLVKKKVASMCVSIHTSVSDMATKFFNELRRKYYITPKSYLDCVNLYVELLNEKRIESLAAQDRFINGLNKLKETNELIATMKIELGELQPILAEKSEITNKLLNEVSKETAAAQQVKETVVVEEKQVKEQAAATQLIKDDAQKDLDAAMPALNAAVDALNSLNKSDITELKSFAKPPSLVLLTMEAVCILLGEAVGWDSAKKIMADVTFIKRLMEYNKDAITPQVQKKLQKYINDPLFIPEAVQKQSNAATSMCMWVRAMNVYADIAKVVAPKKAALNQAEAALKLAADTLAGKQKQLADVEAQVAKLKANLDVVQADMDKLKGQALLTENRLIRAGKLTSALGDEAVRWRETAAEIGEKRKLLVGDVFLCAVCISYYGAFSGPYRAALVASWIQRFKDEEIPVSDDCSLRGILATPVEVREWNIWGLPSDNVSVDNGILVTRGRRWPLMIDPQGQANSWIKAMEAKNGLRVVRLSDSTLLRTLESSIRIGNPVLLEDIGDTLDPALEPILQKQVFEKKGRWLIRLGDTDVDYDPHFKLYMTTKLSNPHYLPEVCIKVTLVNFTVTMIGLEDQLLGDVVRKERADLEEQNDRLVVSISSDKKQLKDLEDKILRLLKESEGNILDDEVLINTLNNSKLTSGVIQGRVKQAEITEKEIKSAREEYRVVAKRGSILYFIISDLALIDSMYQYSLSYFAQLFNQCIDASPRSEVLEDRLQILIRYMTEFLYMSVSRGLFEEHKLTFSFLICTSIMKYMGEINQEDWVFFLIGGSDTVPEGALPNPDNRIIPDRVWVSIVKLEETRPETFKKLTKDITSGWANWSQYFKTPEPHIFPLPGVWKEKLTPFQQLLLLKVMRGEKLVFGVNLFVTAHLGQKFVGSVPLQLEEIFKDTSCINPVIFILTTGADPSGMLQRFAEKMDRKAGDRLHMISLGQGQGPVAETLIMKSRKSGDWVCLQNCHLASSWMIPMERIIEKFLPERADIHPDFRLWLTSFPSKDFPVPVLQNGIKLTNEPPKGVRANMLQSYTSISEQFLESCSKKAPWKKLVFGISFFHAVIQERRKFGPLGWNVKYDFNSSDLECALQTLIMFLEEQPDIPWPALLYVTGEINYGGRVTDDLDRRCLMSTLKLYYDPAVLSDTYTFTSTGLYKSPPEGEHGSYVEYIKSFPTAEGPDLFGMHENANLTFQHQESNKILTVVASIQPKASTGGAGKNVGVTILELAAKLLEGLPVPLRPEEATEHIPEFGPTGQVNSLLVVLQQESERFNRLIKVMRSTLVELQRAIKGLVVMSAELEAMFNNFIANKVPELWNAVAYPSLKPLSSWILDHQKRMEFMRVWIHDGNPLCFWLPGFFFPQGFMTGALQNHARKYQIPIDTLNFGFKVMEYETGSDVKQAPEDGLYISGLYLDGARWDRKHKCLVEALPGEIYSPLPVVHFTPIVNYKPPTNEYQCPLYKTHVRAGVLTTTGASSNYILNVSLTIDPDTTPDFWVLQGIALLCQTPY
ncbi:hypothetical protein Mp_8g13060 [Marchantia polymorpha subsp. ruderalis]|uniref:Uncharacterized protein n=1 Tax=Marchantia polymorpha TaxID=3197 RepID=A0A2R6WJK2_MARPO|nr:hypothetical protein MARPO_0083s0015 [Marchantia polymorpha]BBN19721.1 hypothetical protein Mp_8g13060 [Marchantia polymorpha subsp. ruderalis]|eukprot:PTQ34046.1 hypothetical protein MARPO_0083s0015 [Marchantia polymorpha]